eukprot:UN02889
MVFNFFLLLFPFEFPNSVYHPLYKIQILPFLRFNPLPTIVLKY